MAGESCQKGCPGEEGLPEWAEGSVRMFDRSFISHQFAHLMYMPLGMTKAYDKVREKAAKAGLKMAENGLFLHDAGLLRGRLLMEVDGKGDGTLVLMGEWKSTVHRGPWKNLSKTIRKVGGHNVLLSYYTCPDCRSEDEHVTLVLYQ